MSDTNELDNYGVWVKKPPKNITPDADNFDIDLPDLSDLDLDSPEIEDFSIPEESVIEENVEENIIDENASSEIKDEVTAADFDSIENEADENSLNESAQDFSDENGQNETSDSTDTLDINLSDFEDGEIDIDSFLDDSSEKTEEKEESISIDLDDLDSSLDALNIEENSSSNNSSADDPLQIEDVSDDFGLGEINSSDSIPTEENSDNIDLDAFLGDDFAEFTTSSSKPKQEEIIDEEPLDINLSFDESANSFEIEEDIDETAQQEPPKQNAEIPHQENEIDAVSVDLAEFGLEDDESNGLPNIMPDEPEKKEVINYDMKVAADSDDSATVSMDEVISGNLQQDDGAENSNLENSNDDVSTEIENNTENDLSQNSEIDINEEELEAEKNLLIGNSIPANENENLAISSKGQEILEQLATELASLRNEIKSLKNDFDTLKNHEIENETAQQEIKEENTGFFSDEDEDETIALSGAELDNILNTAEFFTENAEENSVETSSENPAENVQEENADFVQQNENPENENSQIERSDVVLENVAKTIEANEEVEADSEVETQVENSEEPNFENEPSLDDTKFAEPQIVENFEPEIPDTIDEEVFADDSIFENVEEPQEENFVETPDIIENISDSTEINNEDFSTEDKAENDCLDVTQEIEVPKFDDETLTSDFDIEEPAVDKSSDLESVADEDILENVNFEMEEPENEEEISDFDTTSNSDLGINLTVDETGLDDENNLSIDEFLNEDDSIDTTLSTENLDYISEENNSLSQEENDLEKNLNEEKTEQDLAASENFDDLNIDSTSNDIDNFEIEKINFDDEVVNNENDFTEKEISQTENESLEETQIEENSTDEIIEQPEISLATDSDILSDEDVEIMNGVPTVDEIFTQPDLQKETSSTQNDIPTDLKQDIKSVLSYMDQLLENLPEDKISEFAQSEHFVTYKKLFQELGLS